MRISETPKLVTVFGGSGFVGRHLVRELANRGHRVRVACRRPDEAFHLQPLGNVGQIKAVQANLRYPWSVERACEGADAVVNLVAILAEGGRQRFDAIQNYGARSVAVAARNARAPLTHISAIGADPDSASAYGRTKGLGEAAVHEVDSKSIIIRPSIVFGPEDQFFNRFASMASLSPVLPLIGAETRFQPVFVGDLATAIAEAVDGRAKAGKTYEIGGPDVMTFRQCIELMLQVIDRNRAILPVPFFAAKAMARLTGWLPGAPITYDQVLLLQNDNVVSSAAMKAKLTLEDLGVEPRSAASVIPSYLWQYRPQGQFTRKGEA